MYAVTRRKETSRTLTVKIFSSLKNIFSMCANWVFQIILGLLVYK